MIRNLLGIVLLLLCVPTVTQDNDQKHAQNYCFLNPNTQDDDQKHVQKCDQKYALTIQTDPVDDDH